MKGSNWISDKRPQLRGLFYIIIYSAAFFQAEIRTGFIQPHGTCFKITDGKRKDERFSHSQTQKNERILHRNYHNNEGIDDFLFSFPDKWLFPTLFSAKKIRFSFQSRNPDSFPFSDSAYSSSPRIVFTATRPCVMVRPTATPTKYSG